MSVSTDGILTYGFSLGEEFDTESIFGEGEDVDWDELYLQQVDFEAEPSSPCKSESPEWMAYWGRKRAVLKASNVGVLYSCSCDYPIYLVGIKEVTYMAHRGSETEIPNGMTAKPEWKDQLRAWCDVMKIEYQEPKWLLASLWG